jgi:putative copper export protein/mono/diheme cytochrome c family protein
MSSLLVFSRALHFAAVLALFGGLVLALAVVRPATRTSQPDTMEVNERIRGFLRAAGWWGLGVSLLSGAAWLLVEAALVGRQSIAEGASGGALWLVLTKTAFGRVWIWRLGLATALGALMFARATAPRDRWSLKGTWLALALAGGYLASLALVGHSATGQGAERYVRCGADAVHALAAGAWLGALPGLAFLFATALRASSTASLRIAAVAARRFSTVGIASVGALLLSGLVNAWYLVGDVPALLGTPYGQLLLAKIALFATMLSLAAVNRRRLTPLVERRDASALRLLTRNAVLEIAAGIAVVAIVGALGVTVPAAHQSPVWPFSFTLSLAPAERSVGTRWILGACIAALAVVGLALAYARRRSKAIAPQIAIASGAVVTVAVVVAVWLLAAEAYPTSYASSPVKYTTMAIAGGGVSYRTHCAQCHGLHGHGDGPSATTLPIKPSDLVDHAAHHRPGDLFWWIAHGIPNTPMPAYSPRLDDAEIWTLIQFLHALSEAQMAQVLTNRVRPLAPIIAPDFSFEDAPGVQETLRQLGGREVLLVFGALPQSLPRLRQLEGQRAELTKAGVRVIMIAASDAALPDDERATPGVPRRARVDSDVTETYAMFECPPAISCAPPIPSHVEWLIDRGGYMRARWFGVPIAGVDRTAEIITDARLLQQESSRPPAPQEHAH